MSLETKTIKNSVHNKFHQSQSSISLCIPRVLSSITQDHIRNVFNKLNIGIINRIDIIPNKQIVTKTNPNTNPNTTKYNRVFIHFKKWNDSDNARIAQERFSKGKDIKVIYHEPWFWKISLASQQQQN
jgi:hypothetical protein